MPTRIVEWQLPYTWGTGIGIDTNKVISVLLREENNLIQVNGDNELYTDLQLVANIKPSDDFPVGVTTWKILQSDWWTQSGLLLNWKTTSGDYARWIYTNDWKIYFDNWTGTWKQVYYSSEVDNLIQTLRNYVDATYQPKLTAWAWITIDQNNVISATVAWMWDVVWPEWATDWNLAVFDGTTGKLIKDWWPIPAPTTVVDALDSTSTTSALSANQGRILDWKIADMMGLGKFLSLWNSTTGQPISFPLATPYTYTTWDYFIIEVVSSATPPVNYRPNGSSYTGTASSVPETDEIEIWDVYVYDWQTWLLQSNHGKTVAFANIAGQPSDNTALANALNAKQNTLTAWTNIDITNNTISAEGLTILSYGNSTWNDFITAYNRGWIVYCRASSNSNPASWNQWRMAFMAYLNNPTTPTEVEFQYYRSRSSHSPAANQLDEVYVYKLSSTNWWTWTVEVRDTGAKLVAGTWIWVTVNSSGATISNNWVTSVNWSTWAVTVNDVKISSSAPASPIEWMTWYDTTNDQLKVYDGTNWQVTGKDYNAWPWISIGTYNDYSAMRWPCPEWFHVPSKDEWMAVYNIWNTLWLWTSWSWSNIQIYLKLPKNWFIENNWQYQDSYKWVTWYYFSCSLSWNYPYAFSYKNNEVRYDITTRKSRWYWIRWFKDSPVIPDSSWTTLYDGSSVASWAWIFHNTTEWLISLSSDWTTWYTIMDKNLWATTVWNSWDTLNEANCGKYYQRWNNYWFPFSWSITTSSTQVDASVYWPWNYYSSSTFITTSSSPYSWDSSNNGNLRWWTTWVITIQNAITNTWVLSVNGQTGDVTIETFQIAPNSPLTPKYRRYWSQTQYDALTQYYTDEPGDTVYFTI